MKIAVLSGKGGTGKTLLSVNLAVVAERSRYIDCDVEEPNGHLFLKGDISEKKEVSVKIPVVDNSICTGCRNCIDFCKYNALAFIYDKVMVMEELCHSCSGCIILCPEKAMTEKSKVIGEINKAQFEDLSILSGTLKIGEASGVPIIKKLIKESQNDERLTIIDCPPGTACTVMESIQEADYCLMVAEPTLFSVHNLDMVHQLLQLFKKKFALVINKYIDEDNPVEEFCREKDIKILAKIPYDDKLGQINSSGMIAARESTDYKKLFSRLLDKILEEVDHEAAINS
ncbi:MAG: AAA family ATPase [Halanaerobiaceae bacterium]